MKLSKIASVVLLATTVLTACNDKNTTNKSEFFNDYFIKLSGTKDLKNQIINNTSEEIIRKSWKDKIDEFKLIRKKYLIYK